jgi:predicted nucleotidyltransferase
MGIPIPREALQRWVAKKPTIKALYVFGSYARNEARPDSDLDIAFDFTIVDEADAELICNAKMWKAELTKTTGVTVKDLYHYVDAVVQSGPTVRVFP